MRGDVKELITALLVVEDEVWVVAQQKAPLFTVRPTVAPELIEVPRNSTAAAGPSSSSSRRGRCPILWTWESPLATTTLVNPLSRMAWSSRARAVG
nr:hypothetical protein [Tsuneonella flava]